MPFRRTLGLASLVVTPLLASLAGCGEPAPDPSYASRAGEVMLARGNCTACHEATAETLLRIHPLAGPRLLGEAAVGTRLNAAYLAAFIEDPHSTKRGTRMPNVLHGLDPSVRAEQAHAIAAYLAEERPTDWKVPQPTTVLPEAIANGEQLYRQVGCAACHGAADHRRWAAATHFDALVSLLRDPLAIHPSGLMPKVLLSDQEAASVAAYMLMAQAEDERGQQRRIATPGVRVEYYERSITSDGLPDDLGEPTRLFTLPTVSIDFPRRDEEFGVRYLGTLDIPADGEYEFHLGSDDGSRLFLDETLIIDHWGSHGFSWKSKRATLKKGPVAFKLIYYEISVDNDLRLEWSGPGIERGPIATERFSHESIELRPRFSPQRADAATVRRGEELFASTGCANCHVAATPRGPKLAELSATRGCLADKPSARAPDFGLDKPSRQDLRDVTKHARDLVLPLPAPKVVAHTLQRMGCLLCHQRDGEGRPNAFNAEFFVADGHAELGDQGRLPPRLDGVGDKFKPDVLATILKGGEKVRPYMLTRMPVFGDAALAGLADAFIASDRVPAHDAAPAFTPESAQAGRTLVGSTGVSCITCHTFNGRASLGVPALDLGVMHERLRPGWFLAFIEHPDRFTPGTRMTRSWVPDVPIFPNLLNGDAKRQREAVWNYLSLGASMAPPVGLRMSDSNWDLMPVEEPLLFTTFMKGVSPRTMCVGYADLVHVAYDAENARLAKAWRGKFMDAAGTWEGRAGRVSTPAGTSIIDLPPGDALAVLASRDAPWPSITLRHLGVERDTARVPFFLSDLASEAGDVRVRESAVPALSGRGVQLRRRIEAWTEADRSDVFMRVAVGSAIAERGSSFVIDDALTVTVNVPGAFVREANGQRELLVPVDFKYFENETPRYKATVEVDLLW
jgi:mono/diheme cytochrome c family protein